MGQKGKFVSQRTGYSIFWHDMWYSFKQNHSIHFQNTLIRDFIYFLIFIGFSSISLFNLPVKKTSSMIIFRDNIINNYHIRFRSQTYLNITPGKIKSLKGIYLTKFHILKIFNFIIILGSGYKWNSGGKFKFFKAERRLSLFYSLVVSLNKNFE